MQYEMKPIAHIRTDFPEKFGVPRQSGLVDDAIATVVMEPEYRQEEAFRGLSGFSRIWLIWVFSGSPEGQWSPTVRPPRLGGNERMGVFASRSPFRPNRIGLSCVRLREVRMEPELGPVLVVSGVDIMDGTPILDIKPYLPDSEAYPDAARGFTARRTDYHVTVEFPRDLLDRIPEEKRETLMEVLRENPRPAYQTDPDRVYGMAFARWNVKFRVDGKTLSVIDVEERRKER